MQDESIVLSLHLYRRLRARGLRGGSSPGDQAILDRIEPWIRSPNPVNPLGYRRFKCSLPGTLEFTVHGLTISQAITLVDMSATGARVHAIEGLALGERIHLRIPQRIFGDSLLSWHANVVWAKDGHVGMHFLEIEAATR
ncbi:PilZ domain-containing protein [Nannocystaceae bacterium ST9]